MIAKIAKYYGKYKKYALITPIFMFLEVACEITIPLITAKLINEGIGTIDEFGYSIDGDINKVILYGVITILLACASLCFGALGARYAVKGAQGLSKNLREAEFRKIQDFSSANIDKFSTSSLITRMTTDITSTSGMFQMLTRMTVRAPLTFIFAVIMAFIMNPRIASIIACTLSKGGKVHIVTSNIILAKREIQNKDHQKLFRLVPHSEKLKVGVLLHKNELDKNFENEAKEILPKELSKYFFFDSKKIL